MQVTERLDRYQRRHPWAGFPVAVIYKFFDDQGTYLAALMTFYRFLSLFPLLLLLASVLGFILQSNPQLQHAILDSALSQFPIIGDELRDPTGLRGSAVAVVVAAVYGALGVAQATQNAMNVAWAVPRNCRPNPIKARCAACCSSRPPASRFWPQRSSQPSAAAPALSELTSAASSRSLRPSRPWW